MRILVIEDDEKIASFIVNGLSREVVDTRQMARTFR
jgi:DNA-binding response OmpR family regulator